MNGDLFPQWRSLASLAVLPVRLLIVSQPARPVSMMTSAARTRCVETDNRSAIKAVPSDRARRVYCVIPGPYAIQTQHGPAHKRARPKPLTCLNGLIAWLSPAQSKSIVT